MYHVKKVILCIKRMWGCCCGIFFWDVSFSRKTTGVWGGGVQTFNMQKSFPCCPVSVKTVIGFICIYGVNDYTSTLYEEERAQLRLRLTDSSIVCWDFHSVWEAQSDLILYDYGGSARLSGCWLKRINQPMGLCSSFSRICDARTHWYVGLLCLFILY